MDTVLDGSLDSIFASLGEVVSRCVKGFASVNDAIANFAQTLAAASQAQQQQQEKDKPKGADMGAVMDLIPASIRQVAARVNQAVAGLQELAAKYKGAAAPSVAKGGGAGGGEESGGGGFATMAMAAGGVALALGAASAAIQGVVSAVKSSVSALSPSTMAGFDRAMRDMSATIGVGFAPIFQELIGIVRTISGVILPMMEALSPVMRSLTESVGGVLVPVFKLFAGIVEALMPVFRILATIIELVVAILRPAFAMLTNAAVVLGVIFGVLEAILAPIVELLKGWASVFDAIGQVFEVVGKVFKALADTIMPLIKMLFQGLGLGKIFEFLVWIIGQVVKAFIIAIATLAKLAGATDFIKNLRKSLEPKAGATAAITNVGIKSLDQISKDMATASAAASGPGEKAQTETDMLAGILDTLTQIESQKQPIEDIRDLVAQLNNPRALTTQGGQRDLLRTFYGIVDKDVARQILPEG